MMIIVTCFFVLKMEYTSLIIEIIQMGTVLYCFEKYDVERKSSRKKRILSLLIICISIGMKEIMLSEKLIVFLLQLIVMAIYVGVCFYRERVYYFSLLFILYVIFDLFDIVLAFFTFPMVVLFKNRIKTQGIYNLNMIFHIAMYCGAIILFRKRKPVRKDSLAVRVGVMLLLGFSECILLTIRQIGYNYDYVMIYSILLFSMIFSVIVLVLWLFDKSQEQKKIQELTAYAHRTREVIPSMNRMLNKLAEQSGYTDRTSEIIQELKQICDGDMGATKREAAVLKTFETTECFALDGQLERYLEEAAEQGFELDIMVRASVKEILNEKKIELYSLLQVVGDLYRNAYKAVLKNEKQGRILICFGYNWEGYYEISIHDNGPLFPEYVLKHLGERGVTTDGTGHGMADIFEVLERNRISYVLNQDLPKGGIFTKSICLVFDDKGNREINCR